MSLTKGPSRLQIKWIYVNLIRTVVSFYHPVSIRIAVAMN